MLISAVGYSVDCVVERKAKVSLILMTAPACVLNMTVFHSPKAITQSFVLFISVGYSTSADLVGVKLHFVDVLRA